MTDNAPSSSLSTSISDGVSLGAQRDVTVGGDVVGHDKIVQNIQNIYQRALTAAEEARQARSIETEYLAQGVSAFAQRLQARASESTGAGKGSPYKGLLEYRLSDAEIFFGRDNAIRESRYPGQRRDRHHSGDIRAVPCMGRPCRRRSHHRHAPASVGRTH